MCPLCLTTAALFVSGVTSTGGVTALVASKLRLKTRAKLAGSVNQTAQPKDHTDAKGDQHGSPQDRIPR